MEENVRVKIYCIRRSTYCSTSRPSQSVENTPLATTSLVLGDSSIFQDFFVVVITPRQASAALVCARAKVRRWREGRLRSQTWDPPVSETTVMHVLMRHSLYSTQRKYCIKSSCGTKPTTVRFFRLSTYAL